MANDFAYFKRTYERKVKEKNQGHLKFAKIGFYV